MNPHRRLFCLLLLAVLSGCAATTEQAGSGTVLVVGATGQTGRLVVADLRSAGFEVRAFARDADKARRILGNEIAVFTGDVKDPATVGPAMTGVDTVISAIGARGATGPDRPEKVDFEGVRNLVDAAVDAGVGHFLLVSSMGVTREDHPLNKMFGDVLIWKSRGEQALRDSGMPYTIVRPGGLLNEPGGQGEIVAVQGDPRLGQVAVPRADVATVLVEAVKTPASRNKTVEVYRIEGDPVTDWPAWFATLQPD
ncbi:MAG: SDR family oxidoreductase [Gammaproteobacteria bacterium]|nr:SDR family oxidoreductase [Gammaproteobacteria bacterium]